MRTGAPLRLLLLALSLLLGLAATGCRRDEPLRIGFVGPLSGRGSSLGIAGRDGVLLAVEECNRGGGIAGRPVELLIEDDRQDLEAAAAATKALLDRRVAAIVGPMTSNVLPAMVPLTDAAGIVLFSPTCSTEDLTGKEDSFVRMHVPIGRFAYALAHYLHDRMGLHRVNVVVDRGNWSYTGSFLDHFRKGVTVLGGEIPLVVDFVSAVQAPFAPLARQLTAKPADALLILANAPDTALLAQQLAKVGNRQQLVASEWSSTPELLAIGGHAVEGMLIFHSIDETSSAPAYQTFRNAFADRFGYQPGFAATYGYESARLLLEGLREDRTGKQLREVLQRREHFTGLQGEIHFDRFGDPTRAYFPLRVINGRLAAMAVP